MPFASKAQARWMFWKHPEMAKRWAEHTPSIKKLPEHVEGAKASEKVSAAQESEDMKEVLNTLKIAAVTLARAEKANLEKKASAAALAPAVARAVDEIVKSGHVVESQRDQLAGLLQNHQSTVELLAKWASQNPFVEETAVQETKPIGSPVPSATKAASDRRSGSAPREVDLNWFKNLNLVP